MNRRTPDEIINEVNNTIKLHDQFINIKSYNKSSIEFDNGLVIDGDVVKFYRKLYVKSDNIEYFKFHDEILNHPEPFSKMHEVSNNEKKRLQILGGTNMVKNNPKFCKNAIGRVPWNKDTTGVMQAWNKGLTKETSDSVRKISDSKIGKKNPMFGKTHSQEVKDNQSRLIKDKILNGEFTPCIKNSRTHWTAEYNGMKYRSTWEMNFHKIYPELEYETIRIQYNYDNKQYVYIVDFVDEANKVLYEIKPLSLVEVPKNIAKHDAAIEWCKLNNYTYKIITEIDEPRMVINENKVNKRN